MALHLSKSRFTSSVQCPKMLWLRINKPELFDQSVIDQSVMDTGNEVGDLAMGLFGEFTEVKFQSDLGAMVNDTYELIDKGTRVIAEASFAHEDGFCSVDILINNGNKEVELYEVKSSTDVHDIYRYDVAYQYHILTKLGFTVTKASLVHINNQYVRHGELDLNEFFTIVDLTEDTIALQREVEQRIQSIKEYMKQTDEPTDDIGEKCFAPYDCGFWCHCTENLPSPNVFDLASVKSKTMFKNYRAGIISFEDIYHNKSVNDKAMLQITHELHECEPHIDINSIKECVEQLYYPIYFLDFESFNPAIPLYDDSKPYAQIVFQYSLHYIEEEGGKLKHKEYLAYPGEDPRRKLAEQLCEDIPLDACVVVYNKTFEHTRIKEFASLYEDLADHLTNINTHMYDLMVPFQQKSYYCRAMEGSYSIKFVLPALFPGDPELDYHNLEGVHNGGEASDTFKRMGLMSPEELTQSREQLLKYCGLDTFALVKLWEKLLEVTQD